MNEQEKAELIRKIYDVVLHPEDHDEFMESWEAHVTELGSKFDDRRNSDGHSEALINDDGLEQHFARAHAILEKMGRPEPLNVLPDSQPGSGVTFKIDLNGKILRQSDEAKSLYGTFKTVKGIAKLLKDKGRTELLDMTEEFRETPTVSKFRLFSLLSGGNLLAHGVRNPNTGSVEIMIRLLAVDWSEALENVLISSFSLSPKELELVRELSNQGSLEGLTLRDKRSKHTLRAQLKSVFQKMNVGSQPELMQSIATLARFCHELSFEDIQKSGYTPDLTINFQLNSGRTMPVYTFGPQDGHPVIFIHGMLDGVKMPEKNLRLLDKHNIRFISPVRPGFGSAGFQENVPDAPAIFATDMKELIDHMELEHLILLGHMSGSVFAFAAAEKLAERAIGIVNISGGVPILSTKQFAKVSPRQKAVAYTARYAPSFLPMILRAGVAQIDAMKLEELMDSMYPEGLLDRDTVKSNPEIAGIVGDGYRFAVAQGYKAFQTDAYHVTRDWSQLVRNADAPTLLIHGTHDPVVPIKTVREFSEREGRKLVEFQDDGQLVLYNQPEKVMRLISEFWDSLQLNEISI